jgi:hypothetical protein
VLRAATRFGHATSFVDRFSSALFPRDDALGPGGRLASVGTVTVSHGSLVRVSDVRISFRAARRLVVDCGDLLIGADGVLEQGER